MKRLLAILGSASLLLGLNSIDLAGDIGKKEKLDFLFLLEEGYTQHQGELQINTGCEYAESKGAELEIDEDGEIEEKQQKKKIWRTPLGFEWGITDRLEAGIDMSFIFERRDYTAITTGNQNTEHVKSFEDMELGLRYLLLKESGRWPAITAGYAYQLPTGDHDKELGAQNSGHEVGVAMSKDLGRWVGHFNLGFGIHPEETKLNEDGTRSRKLDLREVSYGLASVYRATANTKLFLELLHKFEEEIELNERKSETDLRILPGISYEFETGQEGHEHEWELGLGFPIGVTNDAADWGAIFKIKYEFDFF